MGYNAVVMKIQLELGPNLKKLINFSKTTTDRYRNVKWKNIHKATTDLKIIQYTWYSTVNIKVGTTFLRSGNEIFRTILSSVNV